MVMLLRLREPGETTPDCSLSGSGDGPSAFGCRIRVQGVECSGGMGVVACGLR